MSEKEKKLGSWNEAQVALDATSNSPFDTLQGEGSCTQAK